MLTAGLIDASGGLALTDQGHQVLSDLKIKLPGGRRPLLKDCLDWTERREHLGGSLPAALLHHAVEQGWVERGPDRSIKLVDDRGVRGPRRGGPVGGCSVAVGSLVLWSIIFSRH